MRRAGATITLVAVSVWALGAGAGSGRGSNLSVKVQGRHLVGSDGRTLQLRGVNFSGPQYACLDQPATFDVPADRHTVAAMSSWKVNAVRIPLNEDCWLGVNGLPFHRSAERYRADVASFVRLLHRAGMYVLLNLHVAAPGRQVSRREAAMADRSHAPAFWRSVARRFRRDKAVLFDLYNEPKRVSWSCWRMGCGPYAGMQRLISAVRSVGARQPVVADGLNYGNDLSGWLEHRPRDPAGQLVAGWHSYGDLSCRDLRCEEVAAVARVALRVPVVGGEVGEFDCAHGYIDDLLPWADERGISYLAWAWNSGDCAHEPALLAPAGGPSAYGIGVRDHLRARAG